MQASGRQPSQAPDGAPAHYERHRPKQTTLYRLVQQHAASFFAEVEAAAGADLPQFARQMAQTAARLVDRVVPNVPVRQWLLSLPIPVRLLLAAQPRLVTHVPQAVHRVITRHLLGQAGLKADEADSGAVTVIQRFGSAANLNIHLHCLVLDGEYRRTDAGPVFVDDPGSAGHRENPRAPGSAGPGAGARAATASGLNAPNRSPFKRPDTPRAQGPAALASFWDGSKRHDEQG